MWGAETQEWRMPQGSWKGEVASVRWKRPQEEQVMGDDQEFGLGHF